MTRAAEDGTVSRMQNNDLDRVLREAHKVIAIWQTLKDELPYREETEGLEDNLDQACRRLWHAIGRPPVWVMPYGPWDPNDPLYPARPEEQS